MANGITRSCRENRYTDEVIFAQFLSPQVDRPVPPGTLLERDVASAKTLGFLLDGPIRTLSQAAMVFCLMNRGIDTTVPGVKNVPEIEEIAGCLALPPIPPHHLARLRELYTRGFRE
jgi:aryl-alcohol dehydrogenase-like predicted oxidoreductase